MIRALLVLMALGWPTEAAQKRDAAVRRAFIKEFPCPERAPTGKCLYEVEHTNPICAGGRDSRENLTWMRIEDHKGKTAHDLAFCAVLRKHRIPSPSRP